jgi:hypothetical protein
MGCCQLLMNGLLLQNPQRTCFTRKRWPRPAAGAGYLVATCGWGLESGYCRIALPDNKGKGTAAPGTKK